KRHHDEAGRHREGLLADGHAKASEPTDYRQRQKVHGGNKDNDGNRNGARAPTAARGHHRKPIPPRETGLVAGEPGEGSRGAHAASSATSARKVSSRLATLRPIWLQSTWRRKSSSVPCAISRPPAMTPMRSAMRSATSRMCVVMMTVPPRLTRSRST